jgi:aldehyde dehydrogenase (NAD+)
MKAAGTNGHSAVGTSGSAELSKAQLVGQLDAMMSDLRATFASERTRSREWRMAQLDGLLRMLEQEEKPLVEALQADVGKPSLEAWAAELSDGAAGIRFLKKNLKKWMKPERVATSLVASPGSSRIVREPLGVVLIISAWNYPLSLAINPLAGALAAGNCAVVKPSEVAPRTSRLLAELLPRYVDAECVKVVEGGVPETTELLAQRFDHIFYTGNSTVGRVIMTAAAKHLTPVTLELGGKSPCIIDEHVDLETACKRIAWGKFYNCGQTCVAPDYVLAHRNIHDRFIAQLEKTVREFWGDDPQKHPDFGRVVNARHHKRLMGLLPGSGEVVIGGKGDESDRFVAPTILKNVPEDSPVMRDEIFGPILPVLCVDDIAHAIRFVNAREKPLALYLFSSDGSVQNTVIEKTSAGGMVVNHIILHLAVPTLPFGGVGESGMGAYHGKHSFDTFSHKKGVLRKPTLIDPSIIYPPYTASKQTWMRRLM